MNEYTAIERGACDPKNPYRPQFCGTFEKKITVGGVERRILIYIPEGVRSSTSGILVLGKNGITADELWESGWKVLADTEERKEKLVLFLLESGKDGWNTEEDYGDLNGDVAYINAAAMIARERELCCVHEAKLYLVGMEEGGTMAHMAAVWNPAFYSGVASVGADKVSEKYLESAANDYCTELDGYQDPEHRYGIKKGDIPMPAWIIEDSEKCSGTENKGLLLHWMKTCKTEKEKVQITPDTVAFRRSTEPEYGINQEKEAYQVWYSRIPGSVEKNGSLLARRIWKTFLEKQRRWMSSPEGDLRVNKDPVDDLHMDYYYEEIDGWMREWYVYVPDNVRNNPGTKVPLVLAMHGYSCSGEIYTGNSEWFKVAQKHGFILIHPTALPAHVNMPQHGLNPDATLLPAWNIFQEDDRPDELAFFNQMLDRMIDKYPVDEDRIFATGHSWGSIMTQMLGLGMTERLAAIAPCSGVFFGGASGIVSQLPEVKAREGKQLPTWMFWGTEEEWLIPATPTHENETGITLDYWMKKNGRENEIPEIWSEEPADKKGRWLDHFYETGDMAPVRYTIVDYMPHATMTEMSFRIWEEFFCRQSRK